MIRRSHHHILPLLAGAALLAAILLGLRTEETEQALCINEFLANSWSVLSEEEEGTEWIELYNGTDEAINLEGYGLSDDPDRPFKFEFGEVTIEPDGFALASTSQLEPEFANAAPLNFRLSARSGVIILTAPDGTRVDEFEYQKCYNEVPYGRAYDGGAPALLNKATPGYSNSASYISRYMTETVNKERPVFSHLGGFYDEPFYLTIEHPEGTTVYYTTDGTTPDFTSTEYTEPIYIEDVSPLPNRYAGIITTVYPKFIYDYGAEPLTKGTIIRARISRDGYLSEYTEDATYFVGQTPEITTVSLITDPDNLFDFYDGIYTSGILGSYMTVTQYNELYPNRKYIGNYWVRGKESARLVNIEFFSENTGFRAEGQHGELRINGGINSTAGQDKPLRVYATSKYGDENTFDVAFTYVREGENNLRQFVIRAKADYLEGFINDVLGTLPFLNDNLFVQNYAPVALYIDGEYWGIAALRDRITVKSVAQQYGLDAEQTTILKYGGETIELAEGNEQDLNDYWELLNYPLTHDMTSAESYQYIADQVDLDSYIRQQLAHIFFQSVDWPNNNIRMFRSQKVDPDNPYSDGKWRYILYDMDYVFYSYTHNTLLYAMGLLKDRGRPWPASEAIPPEWSTSLFRGLMENAVFRAQFLAVYKEYRQTIFQPDYLNALLDEILDGYGSELQRHVERWTTTPNFYGKLLGRTPEVPEQDEELESVREFLTNRLPYMDTFMEEFYASKGETIQWD